MVDVEVDSKLYMKRSHGKNVNEYDRIIRRRHVSDALVSMGSTATNDRIRVYVNSKLGGNVSHMTIARDIDAVKTQRIVGVASVGLDSAESLLRSFDSLFICLVDILNDKGVDADKRINAGKAAAGVLKNRCEVMDMLSKLSVSSGGTSSNPRASVDDAGKPVVFSGFSDEVVSIPDNPTSVKPISSREVPSFDDKHGHNETRYGHRVSKVSVSTVSDTDVKRV